MVGAWLSAAAVYAACGEDTPSGDGDGGADGDIDGDADGDADLNVDTICAGTFEVNTELSSAISTVGIVKWSTTESGVTDASIQFGLTTNYEYTAPVDLNDADFRTLLLGMKPSSTYHYRLVLHKGAAACASSGYTLTTRALPTALHAKTVSTPNPNAAAGGFTVSSSGLTAFILDKDGDYVWWYTFSGGENAGGGESLGRAHISADGKSMWVGNVNVGGGFGFLARIPMDGIGTQETLDIDRHHDFAVLPDNGIAYIEFTDGDGDRIVERAADGTTRTVYAMSTDFTGSGSGPRGNTSDWSHCNAIHYLPADDAYSMSCLNLNLIIKVSRSGNLIWALDGDGGDSDFTGVSWSRQHGHHLLDNGNLLLFNNGEGGFGGGGKSLVLEFALNTATRQADETWQYDGSSSSTTLGDVQRLPNGNTLFTYSNSGQMHEVDSTAQPVRTIVWNSGAGIGYADWRPTLYGAPARY